MSENGTAKTLLDKLAHPADPGGRHQQMVALSCSLLELGLSDQAVFAQFRTMYSEDLPDREIAAIIAWARKQITRHCSSRSDPRNKPPPSKTPLSAESANATAFKWLNGFSCGEADLWEASLIRPGDGDPPQMDCLLVLQWLYHPEELVNINTRYLVQGAKANPIGAGQTRTATQWLEHIRAHGPPQDRAGAWIRMNPVRTVQGRGKDGAHTDEDVAAYRYILLESDLLAPEVALSVFGKLKLPIALIVDNAGRGPHAWALVNAANAPEYTRDVREIFGWLNPLSFSSGNGNPSRLSRLAGARRIIGARPDHDGLQRLLYLAPPPELVQGGLKAQIRTEGIFP